MGENNVQVPGIAVNINSGIMIAGVVAVIGLWWRVDGQADDIEKNADHPVSEARVMVLENEIGHIKEAVDDTKRAVEDVKRKQDEILDAIRDNEPR